MLVGVVGSMSHGKDTTADYLVEKYQFEKRSLATPLRNLAQKINPIIGVHERYKPIRYNDALMEFGYTKSKETFPEFRRFLQDLGMSLRQELGDDVLPNALFKDEYKDLVIPDVRFQNEFDVIKNRGGVIVKVFNPRVKVDTSHATEQFALLVEPDYLITNDGSIEDLHDKVEDMLDQHYRRNINR